MIDLSIIIVNYNGEKLLGDCLRSIYNSTGKISFEIILVDNHSSDNSLRLVKEQFPRVTILENEENLGFCKANNQGLKVYHGRYALLLNNDTIVKEKALDRLVEFMDAHPGQSSSTRTGPSSIREGFLPAAFGSPPNRSRSIT